MPAAHQPTTQGDGGSRERRPEGIDNRPTYVSFDCYDTLIEYPITPITYELVGDQIPAEQWDRFVREFRGYRYDQACSSYYPYEQVLQDSFERVCRKWGTKAVPDAGKRFADGVRSWGPHPDVVEPLKKVAEHYKLVILSNADDSFLAESVPKLGARCVRTLDIEEAGRTTRHGSSSQIPRP
ncbi:MULTISPECIES: hypothetical protein [Streptomyces]|uniref:hypothetical protein n=1 Tax=Streptomyces TaxID=1883 RepID=UPI001F0D43DC|nr:MULTISPECIES: hypothetical protein [Streptomyces]